MPTLWDKDGKVTKGYQKATPRVQNTHPLSPLANIKGLYEDTPAMTWYVLFQQGNLAISCHASLFFLSFPPQKILLMTKPLNKLNRSPRPQ